MSAPAPPSVTASGEVVGSDFGRHGEHPGASMSVAWMPTGRACQQLAFAVSDVRRSQRTTRNTSIKSRDAQDPVPILITGREVEPDLLDEAPRWQADDFWQYALLAAFANVRAAADPAGVPVREACGALSDKPR
jgi:hypothetical protein